MRKKVFALALLAVSAFTSALANDSMGYLAVGGLVLRRAADIDMRSEELYISEKEIRVRYHFFNKSKVDIKTLVAFPIPDLVPLGESNAYSLPASDPVNFLDFETKVDGEPVTNGIEQRAIVDGSDRTELLRRLNIPLLPDHRDTYKAINALPEEQQAELMRAGLLRQEQVNRGKGGLVKYAVALWTLKTAFHWEQVFPSQKELIVEHRYKPFVGGNVGYLMGGDSPPDANLLRDYKWRYCLDDDFLASVDQAKKAARITNPTDPGISEAKLEYVLVTAANWAPPIKDFRLVVDKGAPDNFVSFCATDVKKIATTQFEVRYKNYIPYHNLEVLILHRPQ